MSIAFSWAALAAGHEVLRAEVAASIADSRASLGAARARSPAVATTDAGVAYQNPPGPGKPYSSEPPRFW